MLEDILFTSPLDIKKGDTFSLKEILNVSSNKLKYDQWKKEQIDLEVITLKEQLKSKFISKYKDERDFLEKKLEAQFEKNESNFIKQKNEEFLQLKNKYSEKVASLNSTILNNDEKLISLQNINLARIAELQKDHQHRIDELQNNNSTRIVELQKNKDLQIINLQDDKDKLNEHFTTLNSVLQEKYAEKEKLILLKYQNDLAELKSQHELEQKQANIIGELGEEEIINQLKQIFPNDLIEKPNAALGEADVYQEIFVNGKKLGSIYYEIKNRNKWSSSDLDNFTAKTRTRSDNFNIYIGKKIMKDSKVQHIIKIDHNLFFDTHSKVFITDFNSWLPIVFAIRNTFINYATKLNNETDKKTLEKDLYDFIISDEFKNYFSRVKTNLLVITKNFDTINNSALKGNVEVKKIFNELLALELNLKAKTNN